MGKPEQVNLADPTESQGLYWRVMVSILARVYYLERYLLHSQTIDRRIDYFLAVTSSASIGGWVIWNECSFLWALLIAASQVLNACRHLLPYGKQAKAVMGVLSDLNKVVLACEERYYDVAAGELTDRAIHTLTFGFRDKEDNVLHRLSENALQDRSDFMDEATEKANTLYSELYKQGE